jgi:hypothetical protein
MTAADPVPRAFVDTNILVYAFANDDAVRSRAAQELLDRLMAARLPHEHPGLTGTVRDANPKRTAHGQSR